jgi:deazaflavin-dependent oxidoreductase (nitroreductase family)
MVSVGDRRPTTSKEKEVFSSGGKRSQLILRGPWGLAIDKAIVWATGWSLMTAQYARAGGEPYTPTLMLWTIGARSRRIRSACLPYFAVGRDLVLRGSNGGGPTDPHWVHNVRAHEHAWIRVSRQNRAIRAFVAKGEEREALYAALCQRSRSTAAYAKMCHPRELPLVVLREWDDA